jgi:hypothetical protein
MNFFGILSCLQMSLTQAANEMGMNLAEQEFKSMLGNGE